MFLSRPLCVCVCYNYCKFNVHARFYIRYIFILSLTYNGRQSNSQTLMTRYLRTSYSLKTKAFIYSVILHSYTFRSRQCVCAIGTRQAQTKWRLITIKEICHNGSVLCITGYAHPHLIRMLKHRMPIGQCLGDV